MKASRSIRCVGVDRWSSLEAIDEVCLDPWIAPNPDGAVNVIGIDVDHADGLDRFLELPERLRPHFVFDPWSGRGHALFVLGESVGLAGRKKPVALLNRVARCLATWFGGDVIPFGGLMKNPFGLVKNLAGRLDHRHGSVPAMPDLWEVWKHTGQFVWHTARGADSVSLAEMATFLSDFGDGFDDENRWRGSVGREKRPVADVYDPRGRNCTVFNAVRYFAYLNGTVDASRLVEVAMEQNRKFAVGLPLSELSAIARSVAKFMVRRGGRFGRVKVGPEEARRRRVESAKRAAQKRREGTEEKLRKAISSLGRSCENVSQSDLARLSGLSVSTIKRWWSVVRGLIDDVLRVFSCHSVCPSDSDASRSSFRGLLMERLAGDKWLFLPEYSLSMNDGCLVTRPHPGFLWIFGST